MRTRRGTGLRRYFGVWLIACSAQCGTWLTVRGSHLAPREAAMSRPSRNLRRRKLNLCHPSIPRPQPAAHHLQRMGEPAVGTHAAAGAKTINLHLQRKHRRPPRNNLQFRRRPLSPAMAPHLGKSASSFVERTQRTKTHARMSVALMVDMGIS